MKQSFLFVFGWIIAFSAQAERYQPIIQPIGMAEKIVVRGFKGVLQLVPTDSETLKVEAEKKSGSDFWKLEVRQKQNQWEIYVKSSVEQEGWDKVRAGKDIPVFDIKVTAPQRPIEISWDQGQVFTENWKSELTLQMTSGKAKFEKGQGKLNLQMVDGQIEVLEQQGPVALQTFKGRVILKKNKGALSLDNHSAQYFIDDQQGPVELRNHSGTLQLIKVKGQVVAKNVSGVVRLKEFSGSFQGDFTKGALDAKVEAIQNFKVSSDDAAITLDVPKDSGAQVLLRSEKGHLWAPIHLRRIKKGRWTERKGRLKGKEQGDIKIVSKYGDIMLK